MGACCWSQNMSSIDLFIRNDNSEARRNHLVELFKTLDENGDGIITAEDLQAADKQVQSAFEYDNDYELTLEEFVTVMMSLGDLGAVDTNAPKPRLTSPVQPGPFREISATFSLLGPNHDGCVAADQLATNLRIAPSQVIFFS
eukprot:c10087_g1_i1.p1 GENE.c10087_g1_i1~~c10087_g1_i1.p1  ORF type:complete len:143 (-),score=32.89 c10087_g1_i1:171-599(-)